MERGPKCFLNGKIDREKKNKIIDLAREYVASAYQEEESRQRALAKLEDKSFIEEAFNALEEFLASDIQMEAKDIAWNIFNLVAIEIGEKGENGKKDFIIPLKKPWTKHTH